jgi:DNA-binding response OmpR family regulator
MRATILVVEDQPAMQRSIRMGLEMSGYAVATASDGMEALALLAAEPVDLILADVAMPRMNGYQLYEQVQLNPKWRLLPFVFVSARALDSDVRYGKSLGVDDYLIKPFQLEDLLAIVTGRLRRARDIADAYAAGCEGKTSAYPASSDGQFLTAGALRINPKEHRVWQNGTPVELSPREFTFLEYLVRHPGEAIPLKEMCRVTHGLDTTTIEAGNLLYPLVRSLRRRLGNAPGDFGCIESVRGIGYRLATSGPET